MVTCSVQQLEDHLTILLDGKSNLAKRAAQFMAKTQSQNVFNLIIHQQLPAVGMSELEIQNLLHSIALIDSNNVKSVSGVGEREGRVYSRKVSMRNFGFAHGIGRSGDLLEIQPKALGSAILQRLTHRLVRQAMKICGLHQNTLSSVVVLPCATGMAIMLTLRAMQKRSTGTTRRKVLWPRIDQKSAIKAVQLAGLELIVVPNKIEHQEVRTDLEKLEQSIIDEGPDTILCVLSTTSCFAPRAPDMIVEIGTLCNRYGIGHVVNNAYGLQSSKAVHLINETVRTGSRLDAVVQSTDKNFMVPVGGSIVTGPNAEFILDIGKVYPGRASINALIDLCWTLLEMGRASLQKLLEERVVCFQYFRDKLHNIPLNLGLLLETPHNDVSMAVAIENSQRHLGSMLFYRNISGARLVQPGKNSKSSPLGLELLSFGAHHDTFYCSYLTVASAIGQTKQEIDNFLTEFLRCTK